MHLGFAGEDAGWAAPGPRSFIPERLFPREGTSKEAVPETGSTGGLVEISVGSFPATAASVLHELEALHLVEQSGAADAQGLGA